MRAIPCNSGALCSEPQCSYRPNHDRDRQGVPLARSGQHTRPIGAVNAVANYRPGWPAQLRAIPCNSGNRRDLENQNLQNACGEKFWMIPIPEPAKYGANRSSLTHFSSEVTFPVFCSALQPVLDPLTRGSWRASPTAEVAPFWSQMFPGPDSDSGSCVRTTLTHTAPP